MINAIFKRLIALTLCVTLLFCIFTVDAFAKETEVSLSLNTYLSGNSATRAVAYDDEALAESINEQLKNFAERVDIYKFKLTPTEENQQRIIDILSSGLPECFHIALEFQILMNGDYMSAIVPNYIYTKAKYEAMLKECSDAADEMLEGIEGNSNLTDVEKLLLLHDRIALSCEYDYERYSTGNVPLISYSMYGVFVNRIAVCQGYSLAYAYLLDRIGIENYFCRSNTLMHMWNIVYVNGKPYHVDVTWDDPVWDITGEVIHDNFLVSTEKLKENLHDADDFDTTPTDTTYDNYFWQNSRTAFTLLDGEIYYIDNAKNGIMRYSDKKSIYNIKSYWMANATQYYPGNYARLDTDGKDLLFSLSNGIYKFDLNTGKATMIYKPTLTNYFNVYGFTYDDGMLIYDLSPYPMFDENTKKLYEYKVPYTPTDTPTENPDYLPGDIDGNKVVNLLDVALLAQVVAGWNVTCIEAALDVDGDENISLTDVVHLSRYVAEWEGIELH